MMCCFNSHTPPTGTEHELCFLTQQEKMVPTVGGQFYNLLITEKDTTTTSNNNNEEILIYKIINL